MSADIGFTFASVFDRLERATPEQRKQLFHRIEARWCRCGREHREPAPPECRGKLGDSARLDFLESQSHCEIHRMGTEVPYWLVQPSALEHAGQAPTLRRAIDDARGVPAPTTQP